MIDQEAHAQDPDSQSQLVSAIGQATHVANLSSSELADRVVDPALVHGGQAFKVLSWSCPAGRVKSTS
jgi:hypothetical protein